MENIQNSQITVKSHSRSKTDQSVKNIREIARSITKRLYTLKEAAEYLGRSEWSMRELIWGGEIPVVRQGGGRKIFLDILDLMEFVEKNKSTYL